MRERTPFADLALARRLEAADAARHMDYAAARARQLAADCCAWERIGAGYAIFAGPNNPYSRGIALGLDGPMSEAAFEQFEAFYCRRGAPPALSLCPLADRSLVEHLNRRSYAVEMFMDVWYRPLARSEAFPAPPPEIDVRPITSREADLWVRTAFGGGLDSDDATPTADVIIAAYPHMANTTCYLAWLDGQPAGAATLALQDGMASLFGTSTRPAWRRRGVQAALIAARLADAAATGCDLAAVHTEPGSDSQRNVERLGFRLAYTQVTMRDGGNQSSWATSSNAAASWDGRV